MPYDRAAAVAYAREWAYRRNPAYLDFERLGGDCTNFASQVLHAGGQPLNYEAVYGWYYINSTRRTASWTGVKYLYEFLVGTYTHQPRAIVASLAEMQPGDIIQLSFVTGASSFQHSPIVVNVAGTTPDMLYVAAHSTDAYHRPLASYPYTGLRPLHIIH